MATVRTFVYGSCVSRDTFERLPREEFQLLHYVARQSLISAFAPPPDRPPPPFETTSAFQRRMLTGDWESSLWPLIREHAARTDLLLWDLCDERLGLRQLEPAPGHVSPPLVTRSVDSLRTGFDQRLSPAPLIPFGSNRHRLRFMHSLRKFTTHLREVGLTDKVVVLAPAWARYLSNREETPTSFGLSAGRANRMYAHYYALIEEILGAPVVRVSDREVLADAGHPWGPAPFHYDESVYERLVSGIQDMT